MILSEILKEQYEQELQDLEVKKSTDDLVAMLRRIIDYELDKDYDGLKETVIPSIEKAFEDNQIGSVAAIQLLAGNLESFGKKVIHLVDGSLNKVSKDSGGNIYLKEIAAYLHLSQEPCIKNTTKYIRNEQIHKSLKLPLHIYFNDFKDLVLSYFLIIEKKYTALYQKVFSEHHFAEYLKTVVEDYERQQSIFVDLEVKEYIEVIGKEVQAKGSQREARKDTILNLRHTVEEKQMMILGQAGMGKTTSLLYLAKKDAEDIISRKKPNLPIPVYVTLASFDNETETIVSKIAKRMERDISLVEDYLKNGKITLFLDGFNEVLDRIRHSIIRTIQVFIDNYPDIKIIVASRPVAYEEIDFKESGKSPIEHRKPIPAFLLLEMKKELIQEFIQKNYKGDQAKLLALLNMPDNKPLLDALTNPLYLAEFLTIYRNDGESLPASTTIITQRFITLKYLREKDKIDATFNRLEFSRIMAEYTFSISTDARFGMQNPQVPYKQAKEILDGIITILKAETSADRFLRNAVSMNLLIKSREGLYSFAHQSYQDFFIEYDEE